MDGEKLTTQQQAEDYRKQVGDQIWSGEEPPADSPENQELSAPGDEPEQKEPVAESDTADETAGMGEEPVELDGGDGAGADNQVQDLLASIHDLTLQVKRQAGRIGSIQSELAIAKKVTPQEVEAPSDKEVDDAAKSQKKWDDLKSEFPEWGEAIEERLSGMETGGNALSVEDIRLEINQGVQAGVGQQMEVINDRLMTISHPGWKQTINTNEFKAWLASQPQGEKDKYYSDDVVDAIDLISSYENHQGKPSKTAAQIKAERRGNLSKAARGERKTGKTYRQKSEADMTDEEYRDSVAGEIW